MQKFSKKSSLALTLCILSAISSSGYAAEKSDMITYSLDEVVVTATKTELTQKENPRSVEVITKEDIQNTGAISVRDALRTATNIDIVSVNHGGGENISIRGGDTDGVLILVNGRRVAGENYFMSQGSNAYALDRLNLSNVDHIEILRGPASAIYGSGAMSGVINIITKKSEKPGFSVGVATGTNEMSNYYHYDTGKNGKVSVNFDVNFSKLRNIDSKAGKNLLHGPKQAYNLNLDYEMDENNNLNLMLDYAKDNLETRMRDFSVSSSAPDDLKYPITSFTSERKTIALTYDGKNSNSDYSLSASYSQLNRDPYAADTPGTNEKNTKAGT